MVRRPRAAGAPKGTLGTGQAAELTLPGRCTPHCSVRRTKKNTTIIIKIEITSTRRGLAARPVPKGKAAVKGRHRLPGGAAPQPLTLSTSTVLQRGSSRRAGGAAASVGFSVLGQLCKKKEKPQGERWQPAGLGVVTANEGEQHVPALSLHFGCIPTVVQHNELGKQRVGLPSSPWWQSRGSWALPQNFSPSHSLVSPVLSQLGSPQEEQHLAS